VDLLGIFQTFFKKFWCFLKVCQGTNSIESHWSRQKPRGRQRWKKGEM